MNRRVVFVDTGAWFAIIDRSDHCHRQAIGHLRAIADSGDSLATSNLVVQETAMLLSRKLSRKTAVSFLDQVCNDERVRIFHADERIEQEAYRLFRKYLDHDFSVVDCVSFVLMKANGIRRAFAFDRHFRTMHYIVEP